jgi:hypothetical protein
MSTPVPADIFQSEGDFHLNRRDMIAVMAMMGTIPILHSMGSTWLGNIRMERSKGRVAFHFRNKERWVVDVKKFTGSPSLEIDRSQKEIVVRLLGAFYPGTLLPADFTARLQPTLSGWKMLMSSETGINTTVSFERWLLGLARISGSLPVKLNLTHPSNPFQVHIPSGTIHSLTSGWTHTFSSSRKLTVGIAGTGFISSGIAVRPPPDSKQSLFLRPPARRSIISVQSPEADLSIKTRPIRGKQGFSITESRFGQLDAELGETGQKVQRTAILATAELSKKPALIYPSPSLKDDSGAALKLKARRLTYAAEYNEDGDHELVLASASEQVRWMYSGDQGMMLGCSGFGDDMEFEIRSGELVRTTCKAQLLGTMLPPAGDRVIAQPVYLAEPLPIHISFDGTRKSRRQSASENVIRVSSAENDAPLLQLMNPSIELIRPDDLVVQRFEFVNMAFRGEGSDRIITTTTGTPYLIVWHQPQNIGEQAFFETAPNLDMDPDDTDAGTGNESPDPPPVHARYSGPSRVVYKVPPGTTIPYRLEDLLEACSTFEMNVAPNALPPPVAQVQIGAIGAVSQIDSIRQIADPQRVTRQPNESNLDFITRRAETPALRGMISRSEGLNTIPSPSEQRVEATRMIRAQRNTMLSQNSILAAAATPALPGFDLASPSLPIPAPPAPNETAIEAPYRLIVSPHRNGGWVHKTDPGQSLKTGRIELWHSRLGVRRQDGSVNERQKFGRTLRAIWYTDQKYSNAFKSNYQSDIQHENNPFRMSLDAFDRHNLVHLTSNFQIPATDDGPFTPLPVDVNRFMLSSLGAWMDVRGSWENRPEILPVEEWLHKGTLGRDHYVKVVYAGYLFPFGHKASLVKITERKFEPHPNHSALKVAYLRQRMFIIVREPLIIQALGNSQDDRRMPFKSIEITTRSTPMLDDPGQSDYDDRKQSLFWPRVANKDFLFNLRMEDVEGGLHEVSMPLAFIGSEILSQAAGGSTAPLDELIADFNNEENPTEKLNRHNRPFGGQMVAFAPATTPGDTAFEADRVDFNAVSKNNFPFFAPVLKKAEVEAPAVSQLTGDAHSTVQYSPIYLANGFTSGANSANAGEIFLELPEFKDFNVEGEGDKAGGLVQPNMKISAFSRKSGTVGGDSDTFAGGQFDPEKYFGGGDDAPIDIKSAFSPKLFGVIDLWNILEATGLDLSGKAPRFVTESLNAIEKLINDAGRLKQIADQLPATSLGALNSVRTATDNVLDAFQAAISDPGSFSAATIQNQLTTLDGHLATLETQLLSATGVNEAMRREGQYIVTSVRHVIDAPAKILAIVEGIQNFIQAIEMAQEMRVRLEWKPDIKAWPAGNPIFIPENKDGTPGSFVLAVELNANQGSSNGSGGQSFEVLCCLDNFAINLIGNKTFVKVFFNKMAFSVRTGKKPAVDIDFNDLEFDGPLAFVERLRALIPLDGFSDPPYVKVDTGGIEAGFTFEIPSVGLGIITMQNIVLGARVNIPFIGEPLSIGFFFNTRENPCTLTVYGIGGGAFVGVAVNMQGLQIVEASIEFGGSIAFNVAVASGSVHIMAGIYFKMEKIGDVTEITLTGYLRIGGQVSVLALISISIELRMELSYVAEIGSGGKVIGKASLEIKVKIIFFSIGVTITVERKFAGNNNDPTFLDAMGHPYHEPVLLEDVDPWQQYCIAYAE